MMLRLQTLAVSLYWYSSADWVLMQPSRIIHRVDKMHFTTFHQQVF